MKPANIYTYAFLNTPTSDVYLNLPKGNVAQVHLINGTSISAIVEPEISSNSFQNDDEQTIQMVLAHDRVIRELFQQTTVLPLRFGTYFNSAANLLNHIESHTQEYQDKLDSIQGKEEYTLKLIPQSFKEAPKPSGGSGRNYFLAKKENYENQKKFNNAQSEEKYSLLNSITQIYQSSMIVEQHPEEVRLYILVNRDEKVLLSEQFLTWQKACPRWNLILGEPLPPYHLM